jgi:alpha-L-rhamnosidase
MTSKKTAVASIGLVIVAIGAAQPAHAQTPAIDFGGSHWIWLPLTAGQTMMDYSGGIGWFRAPVTLPDNAKVNSAEILVTADNLYTLYVNGQSVGQSDTDPNAWNRPRRFDVAGRLVPGRNVVAVEAVNTAPGPAGLALKLAVGLADGQHVVLASDGSWLCSERESAGWQGAEFDDKGWRPAADAGQVGVAPWGQLAVPADLQSADAPFAPQRAGHHA